MDRRRCHSSDRKPALRNTSPNREPTREEGLIPIVQKACGALMSEGWECQFNGAELAQLPLTPKMRDRIAMAAEAMEGMKNREVVSVEALGLSVNCPATACPMDPAQTLKFIESAVDPMDGTRPFGPDTVAIVMLPPQVESELS